MTPNQRLVLSYFDEDPTRTLAEIGQLVGVSKQAVMVALDKLRPTWRQQRDQAREEAKPVELPPEMHPCAVCKNPVPKNRRTCGGKCAKAWNSLRYHLDPEFRTAQRRRVAQWYVDHADQVDPSSLRWAKRVLKEKGPAPPSRWTQAGGTPAAYAEELGLPKGGER